MVVRLSSSVCDALLAEAAKAHPQECCGILTGEHSNITGALIARNVHPQPASHFEIDPRTLIDAHRAARSGGPQIIGYYHSHPTGLARPSAVDEALSARDGSIWAIIAAGRLTLWRADPDGFTSLPYALHAR